MSYWIDEKALIGRVLAGVELSEDNRELLLRLTKGKIARLYANADCCSDTWIEHLTVPPDIAGATVTGITDSEGVDATEEQVAQTRADREYVDCLRVYHTAIATDRGEIIVEFRNDSNGYYGGWLSGPYFE